MYILGTDETNLTPSKDSKFFIYGGLFLEMDRLPELDEGLGSIRKTAGYRPEDLLKFDTRSRPEQVSIEKATQAKRETVELCLRLDAKFIVCVVHHGILKNFTWSANHVIGRFNEFLLKKKDYGICLVDRLPIEGDYRYLTEKFCLGLDLDSGDFVRVDRIKLFGSTCINASHLSSAVDIVLGSFRYCINQPANLEAAKEMLENVGNLMWGKVVGKDKYIGERGLMFRPKDVRNPSYRKDYEDLLAHIQQLLGTPSEF